jgi:hypothetical protein
MHLIHNLGKVLQKGKLDVSVSHFGPTYFPKVEAVQNCHVQEVKMNLSLGSFITSELISPGVALICFLQAKLPGDYLWK